MTLPLVILKDSEVQEIPEFNGNLEVGSNTTSSGHYGFAGPFLDSVYISGSGILSNESWTVYEKALRTRGKRFCWPLEGAVSKQTLYAEKQKDLHTPWIVQSKYFEGHTALPVEFCGDLGLMGIRVLVGAPKADKYSPFKIFISPRVLFALRTRYNNYHDCLTHVMESITGRDSLYSHLLFADYKNTGIELHSTIDTWGYNFTINDVRNLISLRKSSSGEAANGNNSITLELDNTEPIFTKKYGDAETIYYGGRGFDKRQTCIYNKTLHAQTNGSLTYLEPFWESNGWDGESTVWRIEVRHGQGYLKNHGLELPEKFILGESSQIQNIENELLKVFVQQVRLILPETASRERRCKTEPFWEFVTQKILNLNPCSWVWSPRQMKITTDAIKLTQMAVGCTANLIQLIQQNSCMELSDEKRQIWSPSSLQRYKTARDHVLHEISKLLDEKASDHTNSNETLAASINQMAAAAAADYPPTEVVS